MLKFGARQIRGGGVHAPRAFVCEVGNAEAEDVVSRSLRSHLTPALCISYLVLQCLVSFVVLWMAL